ncbi:MAG TPA: 16S rRNA (cytosine(1402)-N(4))-methyltransferase RsmH [bacterium]|nr:16S rRNA (cytosine(1402)-N(4))-methyltransferase RsmH [bacterium]
MSLHHEPVLPKVTVELWAPPNLSHFVDGTVGRAGHSTKLLRQREDVELLALDRDLEAVDAARESLAEFGDRARVVQGSFSDLATHLDGWGGRADGILLDLGIASPQIDDPARGFSTRLEGPLDLRFDRTQGEPASAWLAHAPVEEIERCLRTYGEAPGARRAAKAIDRARREKPIETTQQLVEIVRQVAGRPGEPPAKSLARVFQALRIQVNDELGELDRFLGSLRRVLAIGGRIVILSYHSLEDRRVKEAFQSAARDCLCPPELPACACGGGHAWLCILTRRPLVPDEVEIARNPRARSAKLRAAERVQSREDAS